MRLRHDDGDTGQICGGEDGGGIEHQGFVGFDGEAGRASRLHGENSRDADDRYVEAHVLVGFGNLYYGKRTAQGCCLDRVFHWGVQRTEEITGSGNGGVSAFHGLDGDAGLGGDDDGLAEVVRGDGLGDGAPVGDVFLLFFIWGAASEDAGFCEEWLKIAGGGDEFDAFVAEHFCNCAQEHVGVASAEVEEELGESPVGTDAGEDLLVFNLAGHDGAGDAFGLEGFDEAGELAEREPVDLDVGVGCGAGVDLGVSLFVDGGDDDLQTMGACGVEEEEGEASVTCDQPEFRHSLTLAQF
jgi:hypothetical protein